MNEAKRRHHVATRYQNEASEMRLHTLEQQAETRRLEVVSRLERNISSIQVRAADRNRFLVAEPQNLQEPNMAMQRDQAGNISIADAIQAQRLQTTYMIEMAEFAKTNQEFPTEEFLKTSLGSAGKNHSLAKTEDEMRGQNAELQQELLSAERALRFFQEQSAALRFHAKDPPLSGIRADRHGNSSGPYCTTRAPSPESTHHS